MSKSTPETGTDSSPETALAPVEENANGGIGAFVSEHPLAAAGAAIAAGAVIGMMLPRFRVATAAGSAIGRTAKHAAKAVAAAETARTLLAGLSAATGSVKAGAHRLAEHVPDSGTVKAGARHALEKATETAQKAGETIARTARRTVKAGED